MSTEADRPRVFLEAVGARLPGPAGPREEILAELADGLLEAADARERAGLEPDHANKLAVAESGDPEALAASFRGELMVARGRRTALALLTMTPIVLALWIAAARSRGTAHASRLFDSPTDHLAGAVLLAAMIMCGAWTLVSTGRASRWLCIAPQLSLLGATAMGALTVISDLVAIAVLTARLAEFPGTLHRLLLAAAIAGSCFSALVAGRAGWSCLAMSKVP